MIIRSGTYKGGKYVFQSIIRQNLIMSIDAGNPASYPGSGNLWTDTVGAKTWTLINNPTYDSGNGGAIVFDPALSQYALTTSFPSTLTNWTVEAWLYHDTIHMTDHTSPCIVTEEYAGNPLNFTVGCTNDNFPNLQAGSYNFPWAATDEGTYLLTGHWYQVAGTWNGTTMSLYVNGALANSHNWPGFTSLRGGAGIRLMSRWDNAQYWGGELAIVRIYDADIGAAGILQNYNANRSRFGL